MSQENLPLICLHVGHSCCKTYRFKDSTYINYLVKNYDKSENPPKKCIDTVKPSWVNAISHANGMEFKMSTRNAVGQSNYRSTTNLDFNEVDK